MAYDLAVIGGGNMGAALLGGLLQGGVVSAEQVVVVEVYPERRDALTAMFPGVAIAESVRTCTSAVLAVKPPDIVAVAAEAAAAGATRVLSIADAYDAMLADRPYREALDAVEARRELELRAGSQFDPNLVELFLGLRTSQLRRVA